MFKDYHKIESSNDSKGKIDFPVGTKLIRILLFTERKFYILKEISNDFVF